MEHHYSFRQPTVKLTVLDCKRMTATRLLPSSSHHLISVPNTVVYNVILTDGTNVTINSGSSLKYQSNFLNNKNRKVYLKGEAFFDVTKNKNAPFIVTTKKLNIKVLGTKFNVSSYNNDKNTSVVLEEGSVSITLSEETS